MYTMQQSEGNKVQVAPLSRRSLGNYVRTDPMQAWDVTLHYDTVEEACVKAGEFWNIIFRRRSLMGSIYALTQFEHVSCVILEVPQSDVMRDLNTKNTLATWCLHAWLWCLAPRTLTALRH